MLWYSRKIFAGTSFIKSTAKGIEAIVMEILISLSAALIGGLLMSRLAKRLHLPAVTAYLVAGLLLGPFFIGLLGIPGLGFSSMESVERLNILSQVALGFIAFTIGNEFRVSQLKTMGRQAIIVGILQAVCATLMVDAALILLHFIRPEAISVSSAITLGAIAAATAPAATLMVVRQYKADGPMTRLLLMVVAIDDAVGLVLFSASFGVAMALESGTISVVSVLVEPVVEIVLSLLLGGALLPFPQQASVNLHRLCVPDGGPVHGRIRAWRRALRLLTAAGVHDDRNAVLQYLRFFRGTDGPCGRLDGAAVCTVLCPLRRGTGPVSAAESVSAADRRDLHPDSLPGQVSGFLWKLCPYGMQ